MNEEEPKVLNYNNLSNKEITKEVLENLINSDLTSLQIARRLKQRPVFIYRLMKKFDLKVKSITKRKERIRVKCNQCLNEFFKVKSQVKKYPISYCNSSCAATYNNMHKAYGIRRSKLEIYLEDKLKSLYPDIEIHCNKKDTINSELDFYFPLLKLAFELNGIFHYEPIFGANQLKMTQNNDQRKFQACLEKGIELCIIDSSKLSYFKESNAKPYLDIIKKIIDEKLSNLN